MSYRKSILILFGIISFYFISIISIILLFVDEQLAWNVHLFTDKMFVFILAPLYLIGLVFAEKHMTITKILRIGSRKKAMLILIYYKIAFTVFFCFLWFVFVNVFAIVKFGGVYQKNSLDILELFIRYSLGLFLLGILSEVFKKSENSFLSSSPYLGVYLVLDLEVLVIVRQLSQHSGLPNHIFFTWIFCNEITSYILLSLFIIICIVYLFRYGLKKDIL